MPARRARREGADAPESPVARNLARLGQGVVSEDVAKILGAQKRRKYHNVPTTVDGIRFDSQKEAERYRVLVLMQQAGEICCLEVHPRFPLVVHGQDCGVYEADFGYVERGASVVEDVKSGPTAKLPTFRLKMRLVWALYGLQVRIVS